jgi:RNA polymerase sigma factor (sigma-70 family)
MGCLDDRTVLRFVTGRLDEVAHRRVDEELARCGRCADLVAELLRERSLVDTDWSAADAVAEESASAEVTDDGEGGAASRYLVGDVIARGGAGELSGLVRVAATRVALNWRDQEKRRATADDWLDGLPGAGSDPELHFMKERHRAELKEELQSVLGTLTARERMVLRLHLVEKLGIDSIARVCSVHRATVARWIARLKETLAARVRDRLIARWQIDEGSLPAFKSLLDSQLDLSLERLLAAE